MPTYEYECPTCGVFDWVQKMTERVLESCPTCGAEVRRRLSAPPFHLKGSGWYKTDYAGKSNGSSGMKEATESKGESKAGEAKTTVAENESQTHFASNSSCTASCSCG